MEPFSGEGMHGSTRLTAEAYTQRNARKKERDWPNLLYIIKKCSYYSLTSLTGSSGLALRTLPNKRTAGKFQIYSRCSPFSTKEWSQKAYWKCRIITLNCCCSGLETCFETGIAPLPVALPYLISHKSAHCAHVLYIFAPTLIFIVDIAALQNAHVLSEVVSRALQVVSSVLK